MSFYGDGQQTTDFGTNNDQAAGSRSRTTARSWLAARAAPARRFRYGPDGSLDASFSGDGKKTTDFFSPNGLTLQADGRIVAVGFSGGDFALARYNPDGTPDTSFSGDGKQTTAFAVSAGASGVALQADGKIVAVGEVGSPKTCSPWPATTRTARSTRASPATDADDQLRWLPRRRGGSGSAG